MACLMFQKTIVRMTRFDFSVTVSDVIDIFAISKREVQIRPTFIVREIPVTFWSLILKCLIPYDTSVFWISILMIIWTLIGRTEMRVGIRPPRIPGQYFDWEVFDELFNSGDYPFYFLSGKLTRIVFSIFQKGPLPAMYTSFLLTALLTPSDSAPDQGDLNRVRKRGSPSLHFLHSLVRARACSQTDVVHLIQSGRYKLISDKSTWFAEEIPRSNEKIFADLRVRRPKNNPIIDTVSDERMLSLKAITSIRRSFKSHLSSLYCDFNRSGPLSSMISAAGKCYTFVFTRDTRFEWLPMPTPRLSAWNELCSGITKFEAIVGCHTSSNSKNGGNYEQLFGSTKDQSSCPRQIASARATFSQWYTRNRLSHERRWSCNYAPSNLISSEPCNNAVCVAGIGNFTIDKWLEVVDRRKETGNYNSTWHNVPPLIPRDNIATYRSSMDTTRPLRILVAPSGIDANGSCPYYPEFSPSVDCAYPGWCLEIIDVLLRSGNISHEFIVDRDTGYLDWGTYQDNGSFSGVLGRINSGEVDMSCLLFQKSVIRLANFDFSVSVSEIRPTFIVREIPVTLWSLILLCLRPYDTYVWIGMLIALIVQMFVWSAIGKTEMLVGFRPRRLNGNYFSWDVFDEMFNGGDHPFHFISGKLARLVFTIFQKGLLQAMYTAFLLTALLTPVDIVPIKSQTDAVNLIKSGRYKLISDRSKWFAQEIKLSTERSFVDLREATKINPIVDLLSEDQALGLVSQGGYIFQTQDDDSSMIAAAGKCYTFVFTKDMPFRSAHFVFKRGSPWVNILNAEIMKNYPYIDQNRHFRQPKCPPGEFATPGATDPLNFWSVSGIFMLATCGLIISMIILIVEMAVSYLINSFLFTQQVAMPITLTSSDDKSFSVDRLVIKHAGTIETLISTMGLEDSEEASMPIPLPNVTGPVLELVIKWLDHHKEDPVKEEKEDDGERRSDDIPQWDQDFLKDKPQSVLFDIFLAANYLDIKGLLQTCCKTVANMIKGKSPEEIRQHFNIKNDFTPEEEEQIRKENAWCEN
uniref:Uncharacterized protein n=1 Tax=Pristionchus pacificus TaxID=54126 RepID=A0A2A6BSF5_PRIPA|eukprot:PDM68681.1 hypothetical protein PRIPAC_46983 [Pristionchus pacificus]